MAREHRYIILRRAERELVSELLRGRVVMSHVRVMLSNCRQILNHVEDM